MHGMDIIQYHSHMDPGTKLHLLQNIEYGRYRYLRAPQGYTGSGDAYTKRFDMTVDVKDIARCIDESCLRKPNVEDSFWHTLHYIHLCGRNGIIFNPEKFFLQVLRCLILLLNLASR